MVKTKIAKFSQGNKFIGFIFGVEPNYKGFPYATFSTKTEGLKKLRTAGYKIVTRWPTNLKKF